MPDATGGATPRRPKWAIQVVSPDGDVMYLRLGRRLGVGPVVQFRSKQDARINVDFIAQGLDAGTAVNVVRYRREMEHG